MAICIVLSVLTAVLHAQAPGPPPTKISPHKTEASATVLSMRPADDSGNTAAVIGDDISGNVTFTILKLRIHTVHALTSEGTPITNNSVIEAVTRDSVENDLIGKKVEMEMEERGNLSRHRWLVTNIHPESSLTGPKKEQEKK